MKCEDFQDVLELYALGALERGPADSVAEHLETGCPACREALRQALEQIRLVSSTVQLVDPPSQLRRRLRQAIAPAGETRWRGLAWGLATAALLLVAFTVGQQIRSSSASRDSQTRVSAMLQLLSAPSTRNVAFTDSKTPTFRGNVYLNRELGAALIVDHLPVAPKGWVYESWLVPKSGTPHALESFGPDNSGHAITLFHGPVDLANLSALAVSLEPAGSRPVKPTRVVFAAATS